MAMEFYTRNARVEVSTYGIDGLMNFLTRLDLGTDWMHRDYEPHEMERLIRDLGLTKKIMAKKDTTELYILYEDRLDDIIDFVRYCQRNRISFKHGY